MEQCSWLIPLVLEYNKINNWCNQLAFGTDGVIWFRQSINTGPFDDWVRVN